MPLVVGKFFPHPVEGAVKMLTREELLVWAQGEFAKPKYFDSVKLNKIDYSYLTGSILKARKTDGSQRLVMLATTNIHGREFTPAAITGQAKRMSRPPRSLKHKIPDIYQAETQGYLLGAATTSRVKLSLDLESGEYYATKIIHTKASTRREVGADIHEIVAKESNILEKLGELYGRVTRREVGTPMDLSKPAIEKEHKEYLITSLGKQNLSEYIQKHLTLSEEEQQFTHRLYKMAENLEYYQKYQGFSYEEVCMHFDKLADNLIAQIEDKKKKFEDTYSEIKFILEQPKVLVNTDHLEPLKQHLESIRKDYDSAQQKLQRIIDIRVFFEQPEKVTELQKEIERLSEQLKQIELVYLKRRLRVLCNTIYKISMLNKSGFVHLDLHSGNIMIDPDTLEVKLIDFGRAEILTVDMSTADSALTARLAYTDWYGPCVVKKCWQLPPEISVPRRYVEKRGHVWQHYDIVRTQDGRLFLADPTNHQRVFNQIFITPDEQVYLRDMDSKNWFSMPSYANVQAKVTAKADVYAVWAVSQFLGLNQYLEVLLESEPDNKKIIKLCDLLKRCRDSQNPANRPILEDIWDACAELYRQYFPDSQDLSITVLGSERPETPAPPPSPSTGVDLNSARTTPAPPLTPTTDERGPLETILTRLFEDLSNRSHNTRAAGSMVPDTAKPGGCEVLGDSENNPSHSTTGSSTKYTAIR